MNVKLFVLVAFASGFQSGGSVLNSEDDIAKTPLIDTLKAPLFAEINMSSVDNKLRQFIMKTSKQNVETLVKSDLSDLVGIQKSELINELKKEIKTMFLNLTSVIETKINETISNKIGRLQEKIDNLTKQEETPIAQECSDLQFTEDGVYTVHIRGNPVKVYCISDTTGKWTVIQRRFNRNKLTNFYRNWQDYKLGFGDVAGDHWLGNEYIHLISTSGKHQLRIKLQYSNKEAYANYSTFKVGDELSKYVLTVTGYSGTAGDSMDKVGIHGRANGEKFSTKDQDNDSTSRHCATILKGGWWYRNCEYADLNGDSGSDAPNWSYNFGVVDKSVMMIKKS